MTNVNQGSRVAVSLPDFKGLAGFVESEDEAQLSYRPPSQRIPAARTGTRIVIEGMEWEVVSSARSAFVRDHRVLTLKRGGSQQAGAQQGED